MGVFLGGVEMESLDCGCSGVDRVVENERRPTLLTNGLCGLSTDKTVDDRVMLDLDTNDRVQCDNDMVP